MARESNHRAAVKRRNLEVRLERGKRKALAKALRASAPRRRWY